MFIKVFSTTITARVLVAIPLLLLLVSCGKNGNSTSGGTPSTPGANQKTTSSNVPQSRPLHSIGFDVTNIHIYTGEGIVCMNYGTINSSNPTGLHANLVLATNRLTYDSAELQQMEAYATAIYGTNGTSSPSAPPAPSGLFSWVPGTTTGSYFPSAYDAAGCFAEIELTNTGKNPILIRSINMQLTAVPVRMSPSYQYRMINLCSLLSPQTTCPTQAGGGGPLVDRFQLKAAPSGTVFTPEQDIGDPQYQSGPDLVLNPNAGNAADIFFYFASFDNLVYPLTPELLLDNPNGAQQAVPLPQLATTLYFANPSQFSCYTLQGNTFVKVSTNPENSPGYCV